MDNQEVYLFNIEEIEFPNGLVGLSEWKNFSLQQSKDIIPVALLHSLDEKGLSYIVADPRGWFPQFQLDVPDEDWNILQVEQEEDLILLSIINVESDPFLITANLIAPILINKKNKIGVQTILHNSSYMANHPLTLKTKNVHLKEGLLGIPEWKNFVFQEADELSPVKLLVSKDSANVSFPVIEPFIIDNQYKPDINNPDDIEALGKVELEKYSWYVILNITNEPFSVHANMKAPIAIDPITGEGRQVVLMGDSYERAYPLNLLSR